jgi:hypothetical protein
MNKLFENWNKFLEEDSCTREQIEEMVRQELEERCWKGYKPTKGVKPYAPGSCELKEELDESELEEAFDKDRMKCNSPRYLKKGDTGYGKKQKVVKACKKGKEKIVKFGDANMENKSDNPKNKADFNSRHDCKNKKDKFTAGYWSCKDW